MMNRSEMAEVMGVATNLWPATPLNKGLIDGYFLVLGEHTKSEMMKALKLLGKTHDSSFLPGPAVFDKAILEITQPRLPDYDEIIVEVRREIKRIGFERGRHYRERNLSPAAEHVVECIGWQRLCDADFGSVGSSIHAQCREAMKTFTGREVKREQHGRIESDAANRLLGDIGGWTR